MTHPLRLKLELPRKGSVMTAVYDPSLGSFVLAEKLRDGKLILHERLDAIASLDIEAAREFCLRAGAAWSSRANLASG